MAVIFVNIISQFASVIKMHRVYCEAETESSMGVVQKGVKFQSQMNRMYFFFFLRLPIPLC